MAEEIDARIEQMEKIQQKLREILAGYRKELWEILARDKRRVLVTSGSDDASNHENGLRKGNNL